MIEHQFIGPVNPLILGKDHHLRRSTFKVNGSETVFLNQTQCFFFIPYNIFLKDWRFNFFVIM